MEIEFSAKDKIQAFKLKLGIWKTYIHHSMLDSFTTVKGLDVNSKK